MRTSSVKTLLLALLAVAMLFSAAQSLGQPHSNTNKPQLKHPVRRKAPTAIVPVGTNLKVRLEDTLSSKDSRVGDKFNATVLSPSRYEEAALKGHISSIQKSGKIKGRTTMTLSFDSVELKTGRKGTLHGYVTHVYGSGNARADEEGGVHSGSRGKQTAKRSAIGAAAGAIIGGIAGGGKGAAIGLIIGGAGGAGSLAVQGSKELKIESGTEMLVHVTR